MTSMLPHTCANGVLIARAAAAREDARGPERTGAAPRVAGPSPEDVARDASRAPSP